MSFDRCDPVNFPSVFQDQFLRFFAKCLERHEVVVLGSEQVFLIIWSGMNCCLHCRGHKYSPDYPFDVEIQHLVLFLTTRLLSYVREDFSGMER